MIEIKQFNKTFHLKSGDVTALDDVNLTIRDGEIYGVIGYSGAGKSTLVRCINLLEVPDSGELSVSGKETVVIRGGKLFLRAGGVEKRASERWLNGMRRGIGMIFQQFNLLDRSTVFDNVAYPLRFGGMKREDIRRRVMELLELVDLTDKADVYPSQLSGGQKQRVAIARALANHPAILLSDEATSALDPDATESILTLLKELNKKLGLTIVLITHEMAVIKAVCDRVAVMEEGRVVEEGEVYDVFAQPRERITRKFVSSASPLSKLEQMIAEDSPLLRTAPGARLVRLQFRRDSVGASLISEVSRTFGVDINIILANVEEIQGTPLGGLIAVVEGDSAAVDQALAYLAQHHVSTEVIDHGTAH
ncbi:MAG: ATP-binding cassette domain-containing protein [Christensenellaceae bacterium]|nr:ATP-binding cassette domain-containing protein [Christensenellaceae bacterium]